MGLQFQRMAASYMHLLLKLYTRGHMIRQLVQLELGQRSLTT